MRGRRRERRGWASGKEAGPRTQHGVQHVLGSPADQPAGAGAAQAEPPLPSPPPAPPSRSSPCPPPAPWPRLNRRRPVPPHDRPALLRALPALPACPSSLPGLLGRRRSPPPPSPAVFLISFFSPSFCFPLLPPSENVLLPDQPQPAQGAARFHQGPRVGECGVAPRGAGIGGRAGEAAARGPRGAETRRPAADHRSGRPGGVGWKFRFLLRFRRLP